MELNSTSSSWKVLDSFESLKAHPLLHLPQQCRGIDKQQRAFDSYDYAESFANRHILRVSWNQDLSQYSAVAWEPHTQKTKMLDTSRASQHKLSAACISYKTKRKNQIYNGKDTSTRILQLVLGFGKAYPSSSDSKSRVALSVSISHKTSPAAICKKPVNWWDAQSTAGLLFT